MPSASRHCKRKEPPGTHLRKQPAEGGTAAGKRQGRIFEYSDADGPKGGGMGNTTRQGMKFGLILLLLLAGVVLGLRMLLSREGGKPRYTDMPQLLALCGSTPPP